VNREERSADAHLIGRRSLLAALVGTPVVLATGCVVIPTSGVVEQGDARPRQPDPSFEVKPAPPPSGASPLGVVTGFLQAMTYFQTDYGTAREYLTTPARAKWRPDDGVQIYANDHYPTATDKSASLVAPLTGRIGADRAYQAVDGELNLDLGLVKEDGQWRISRPTKGLLVSEYDFAQFYRAFNLYFFEPKLGSLVPDPIFLPSGNQSATALITWLLRGPTDWLRPAVVSAIPARTTLNLSAPVDSNGVVDVSLSDAVAGLTDAQRSMVAAQVTWTLRQLVGITGVTFQVNGTRWSVPRDEVDGVVRITALALQSPIAPGVSSQLVGASAAGVVRIEDNDGRQTPVDGPWGQTKHVSALALGAAGGEVSGVVGTALKTAALGGPPLKQVLAGELLLRPQYSRFGELWTIDSRSVQASRVWVIQEGKPRQLRAPGLAGGGRVLAFRVSPDGIRVAVVQQREGRVQLGLLLINRAGQLPVLQSWRGIDLSPAIGEPVRSISDVAWLDATTLMALGAPDRDSQNVPYITSQDGASTRAAGTPDQWNATMLAASPRDQDPTSPGTSVKAVLLGQAGAVFQYEDDYTWSELGKGVTTVAFPG